MVTGYYPDQISKYTKETQFRNHSKALDEIDCYYESKGTYQTSLAARRNLERERKVLNKYYRKFKKKEETGSNDR